MIFNPIVGLTKRNFIALYNQYFDDIRRYIYYRSGDEDLAADIAQDTYTRLHQMDKLNYTNIKSLLYKIANQFFLDHLRKENRMTDYQNYIKLTFKKEPSSQDHNFTELKEYLEYKISAMPENERIAYLMSRIEGLKYAEIAERLDVNIKTVEKRISHALRLLKQELEKI